MRALQDLRILKIPNNYCKLEILDIGKVFPHLRELSLGYFYTKQSVDLTRLESCRNLETLSIGVDCGENIPRWQTLQAVPSLRSLIISIYQFSNPANLFDGLSQVTQLTHLKLVPHQSHWNLNISAAIERLFSSKLPAASITTTTATPTATTTNVPISNDCDNSDNSGLNLTTLLISNSFFVSNPTSWSPLPTLKELQLTTTHLDLPDFPRLDTLHVVKHRANLLNRYKDQLVTVFYKDEGIVDVGVSETLSALQQMPRLKTLKLNPSCTLLPNRNANRYGSQQQILTIAKYFRQNLALSVQVEIDYSSDE